MSDELDGVIAAPANHKVIFENDAVRVLETTIAPGETTPLHTHLAPQVMYVRSASHFVRRDEHGATMVDTRSDPAFVMPKVLWSAGLGRHTIENTGTDALVVIGVELKGQADPTLDRLLRHMAWANAALFARLAELPDHALDLRAPRNEWSVARIAAHLVSAAGRYACRLEGAAVPPEADVPTTAAGVRTLAGLCAGYDARLRAAAAVPDGIVEGTPGRPPRARSTIIAQSIHHATEHRAQIAGALATNGIDAIDLDALDLWSYGDAEGLGA